MHRKTAANSIWSNSPRFGGIAILLILLIGMAAGCGTTTQRTATEQLLMSDAVDQTVSQLDFAALSGEKVYLDTSYLKSVKGSGFVNADYIVSSLRQQMAASHCLLQEKKDEADIIVEARVGTLGTDGHEITYGVPATTGISTAASLFTNSVPVPVLPEISIGRIDAQSAVAKVALFAYHKETRHPIWQSGIAKSESNGRNTWVLGAGPFQKGSIYEGFRFAGASVKDFTSSKEDDSDISYFSAHEFPHNEPPPVEVAEKPEKTEDK